MIQILIMNGPNLNLLGKREKSIYGEMDFESYYQTLVEKFPQVQFTYFQSNHEGDLIDKIHELGFTFDGIVLNAGAYTHTSVALADAIAAVSTKVVEVHISNVYSRESFRHHSFLTPHCAGLIVGFGLKGYELAVQSFISSSF